MTIRHRLRLPAILVVLAIAAAACGSSSSDSTSTTTSAGKGSTATTPEPLDQLRIYHPETLAFAAPFTLVDDQGPLSKVAKKVTTDAWTTPDVLRSLLVANKTDITALPTYVGANLSNKGVDVHLAAVVVWGLLWVIGPDGTPGDWESLRGQTLMVPFQNDMPDLVFQYLAKEHGMTAGKDFTIEYYTQPPEVVARLVSKKGSWAVLPEHVASLALAKAGESGNKLTRVLNLQAEWAKTTGGKEPRIPQAGVVVPSRIAERPDVLGALLDELEADVAAVNAANDDTLAKLSKASGIPAPMVKSIIPRLNLKVVPAAEARKELERFYSELAKFNPDIIGGKLPDAGFYLADPR